MGHLTYHPSADIWLLYLSNCYFIAKKFRTNQKISAPTVRLIDDDGGQQGIMAIEKALELAKSQDLDLVEVAPRANPPVCRILDYGKFSYKQQKIDAKQRKMQKQKEVKGIRIGFRTGAHDIEIKANKARKFLADRNTVKVALVFKGREAVYKGLAKEKMKTFADSLEDVASLDEGPKSQGNTLFMILTPNK